ncbi:MAG: hypothetical protein COC19_06485 [SAR86 cluster bacterium]|uniref:Sulfatase-modifying factor enzyme-like domain-containing protein n=1 Tax=SAR86 cluster bacterium TaxID=2030880 RepID=A0A2A4MIM5_9GAMM|nr:MAG: hypothetical protein COC19_06485 [SAR86 cluster bacterium]
MKSVFDEYTVFARDSARTIPSDEGWGSGNRPVINVSWQDASDYAAWLSDKTQQTYRLPTEAEWEYVAKVNDNNSYSWGSDFDQSLANCTACAMDNAEASSSVTQGTSPVGSYPANAQGVFDLHGNVWEWLQDCAYDNYVQAPTNALAHTEVADCSRILRGGAWDSQAHQLRVSYRNWEPKIYAANNIGFRLLREIP